LRNRPAMKLAARARGVALALACAASLAAGVHSSTSMHMKRISRSFVRSLSFKYTIRVCNAYPFSSAIDAYMESSGEKLNDEPMVYKTCKDFTPRVTRGDRVDFKIGDISVGTFTISDLPNNDAVLLMVVYRRGSDSNAVAFESHVYSNVASAQVAVLDVYKGRGHKSELRVTRAATSKDADKDFPADVPQSELLQYESVVALDSGVYNLALVGAKDSNAAAEKELVTLPNTDYVIIRCGVNAEDGPDYPQDLIVFPHSDKAELGGSMRLQPSCFFVLALLSSFLFSGTVVP